MIANAGLARTEEGHQIHLMVSELLSIQLRRVRTVSGPSFTQQERSWPREQRQEREESEVFVSCLLGGVSMQSQVLLQVKGHLKENGACSEGAFPQLPLTEGWMWLWSHRGADLKSLSNSS